METSLREQLAQSEARHEEQLTQSLAQLEARNQEQLSQAKARRQQQMAEVLMHMREMFTQLSPYMHDSNPSQIANKCYLAKHYFFAMHCYVILIRCL